ncbi:MAG: hypothetical protein QM715_14145 [Nibricoccus sp.]
MKKITRLLPTSTAFSCPLLAAAPPGSDGLDLIWDFRSGYDSPIFLFLLAMGASALVFRFGFGHK